MSLFRSLASLVKPRQRGHVPKGGFTPRLEQLDERLLPSITSMNVDASGVLRIRADSGNDLVFIADRGTASPGNVEVSVGTNRTTFTRRVLSVDIQDSGGTNNWTYNNDASTGVSRVNFAGGSGWDRFIYTLQQGVNADRLVTANGGDDQDFLQVVLKGTLRSGHVLGIGLEGGAGFDDVGVDAWNYAPTIESGASLWANVSGYRYGQLDAGDSANNVSGWFLGRMDGALSFNIMGSGGNDWVSANVWVNGGSTGTVGTVLVQGGGGNDDMQYLIRGDASLHFSGDHIADGGSGYDLLHFLRSNNESPNLPYWSVTQRNIEEVRFDG